MVHGSCFGVQGSGFSVKPEQVGLLRVIGEFWARVEGGRRSKTERRGWGEMKEGGARGRKGPKGVQIASVGRNEGGWGVLIRQCCWPTCQGGT
eukprot:3667538-Rhodomonas_salina.1